MQVLWSRAAQTKSCHCRACINAATAVGRWATTAAGKRQSDLAKLSTAFYSTLIGTAVFVDAKIKEDRRKQWDKAIEEARAGTPAGEEDHFREYRVKTVQLGNESLPRIETASRSVVDEYERELSTRRPIPAVQNGISWVAPPASRVPPLEMQLKILDAHIQQSFEAPAVQAHSQPGTDVSVEKWEGECEDHNSLPPREPKKRLHVEKMEQMISKLVCQLLLRTKPYSSTMAAIRVDHSLQMQTMAKRIETWQKGNTQLPSYAFGNTQAVTEERTDLHKSLLAIFQNPNSQERNLDLMLAKICYNLLVSYVPPNITTYNLLIHHFTQLKEHDLAQVVVDSFLYDSKYRPNQRTVRYILEHYIAKKDMIGFRRMIDRMRSVDGDMNVKKRALFFLQYPAVQGWALTTKAINRGGFLCQKLPRNADIFDSLIRGCLQSRSVRGAIRYVRGALREGHRVDSDTLNQVVKACVGQLDYRAAKSLLCSILSSWGVNRSTPLGSNDFSATIRHCFHQLLSFCGIESSLDSVKELPSKIPRDSLRRLLYQMDLESLNAEIDRFAERILSLQTAIGMIPRLKDSKPNSSFAERLLTLNSFDEDCPQFKEFGGPRTSQGGLAGGFKGDSIWETTEPPMRPLNISSKGINDALKILDKASSFEKRRAAQKRRSAAVNRMNRLRVIESELKTGSGRVSTIEVSLVSFIYARLPLLYQRKYDIIVRDSEDMSISSRLTLILRLDQDREAAILSEPRHHLDIVAAQVISIEEDLLSVFDLKSGLQMGSLISGPEKLPKSALVTAHFRKQSDTIPWPLSNSHPRAEVRAAG